MLNQLSFQDKKECSVNNRLLDSKGSTLSAGQKKKIQLIKLLLMYHSSDVIVIDELDANLDQKTITLLNSFKNKLWNVDNNKIIFEISHYSEKDDIFNKKYKIENGSLLRIN